MADHTPPSSQTLQHDSQATESTEATEATLSPAPSKLDLSHMPPIFVSSTHFEDEDLHELEDELATAGATLTYDIREARIVLSKVLHKKRAAYDLRGKGLWTEEVASPDSDLTALHAGEAEAERPAKRQRLSAQEGIAHDSGSSQAAAIVIDDEDPVSNFEAALRQKPERVGISRSKANDNTQAPSTKHLGSVLDERMVVRVVKIKWFEDSAKAGQLLPLDDYLTYQAREIPKPASKATLQPAVSIKRLARAVPDSTRSVKAASPRLDDDRLRILERAKEDAEKTAHSQDRFPRRSFTHSSAPSKDVSWAAGHGKKQEYAHLLHATTTEEEGGQASDLPDMPDWVKRGVKYACQRSTPANSPNTAFTDQLKKIQLARTLTNDEIGVRAYSTSIASLSAYPYKTTNPREILALPGCDAKIANLFVEWSNTGKIQAVEDLEADEDMKVLRLFYEIWGVGATTAREFYYERGWRELDDVVEYGWSTLTRVQQIGVKYYDEFLDPIPRKEVEEIGAIIHRHAVKTRDTGVQSLIVGGYRRGKQACGDVDIIVSHPDEAQTLDIVNDIVASLEDEGWITHTLLLSLHNSKRNQETLPYKSREGPSGSHGGFDTLDKALVVWQDPLWPTKTEDETRAKETGEKLRNPNIHRRVDIIVAPWRAVGCAVTGWSGGTTFQRDLRRFAKNARGWKFDSSGIRDRANGEVVDVEGFYDYKGNIGTGRAKDMIQAEKRVFEGFGLVYREPWERVTG